MLKNFPSPTHQHNVKMSAAEPELDIKEEYQLWRKNCKFMYEFVSETALTWPSLTVQWLPEYQVDDVINAKLLLGTHTSGNDQEYLKLASTKLPKTAVSAASAVSSDAEPKPKVSSIIKISKKFPVDCEINRARYMPQDANIVASLLNSGKVDLFDLREGSLHASFQTNAENGYCLSWNKHTQGHLLTSLGNDKIAVRDVNSVAGAHDDRAGVVLEASGHSDVINDVSWHSTDANLFASVSDDERMLLFDVRTPKDAVASYRSVSSQGINSLAFSPFTGNLLALGGANSNINLVDLRMLTNAASKQASAGLLHTMMGHGEAITCMEFSPHIDGVLASGSQDRRVIIWDTRKIGEEQVQEDAEDGSPEIFMMHAGHTGAITDLSWCPFSEWTLATLADDNIVHLWQVSKTLTGGERAVEEDVVVE